MTRTRDPEWAALMDAAAAAADAGDDGGAEPLFRRIVAENPRDAEAWHMLAVIALRQRRAGEAIDLVTRALQLDRRNALYLNTLGVAHGEGRQLMGALRCFKRALKERPNYAEGHYNLGKAYRKLGDLAEAERCYLRARRLEPAKAEVANNLGVLYSQQGRYADALALYAEARAGRPDDEIFTINSAIAALATAGPAAAIRELELFIERHPHAASVHAELGRRLLAEGRYAEGWRHYAWRHGKPPADMVLGKRVLLLPDQGLGDQLFFLRFVGALRQRATHVAFACPEKLLGLLEPNPPVDDLCRGGCTAEYFDVALPVGDLPRLLEDASTPPPLALAVDSARVVAWRERLAALGPAPYLGVTWRGGSRREDEPEFAARGEDPLYKEIDIAMLALAVRAWRGTVLILQRLPSPSENDALRKALGRDVHDLSAANDDLAEMAALLSLVDEYVGVSNTNVHVRAGVGKSARVLVPFPPEFRWMREGGSVPWFPGFSVYRQSPSHDWRPALEGLSSDLSY